MLADYVGDEVVDRERQVLNAELLAEPERLVDALCRSLGAGANPEEMA